MVQGEAQEGVVETDVQVLVWGGEEVGGGGGGRWVWLVEQSSGRWGATSTWWLYNEGGEESRQLAFLREGGRKGEGGTEGGREEWKKEWRRRKGKEWSEGGREGGRKGGREGGREKGYR